MDVSDDNDDDIATFSPMKTHLSGILKTPPVDIEFQDVGFSVRSGGIRSAHKQILKSVNGKFCSGELTAILGPSGSGKTTLLNILAGYISSGVTGSITINGEPRKMKTFHKISAFIQQEDLIPMYLTVNELMMIAAKLKLGDDVALDQKRKTVDEILGVLGLSACQQTRTESISGGQRKRLAIALELVNNPPVIFLDEPTTGLDSVSIKQCIDVLETLTNQGRTVICTIHQPPASIFQKFHQTYFIADGVCVYNGSIPNIVPYLFSVGITCPTTYTPAEYIIELVLSKELVGSLSLAIQNGKINKRNSKGKKVKERTRRFSSNIYEDTTTKSKLDINFPASFWTQFYVLYSRMILQLRRNKTMIGLQLINHTFSGLLLGIIFMGIGNDATLAISNFKFCMSVLIFFVYTYVFTPVIHFPLQMSILQREYFNRWYSLKAYFLALTLQNIPLLIVCGLSFLLITYGMTSQLMEFGRFFSFTAVGILVALSTEGLGLAIGSIFSITGGTVVAPSILAPFMIISVYGMGYGSKIESYMKVFLKMSYIRCGIEAITITVFENRPPLECSNEMYCHYSEPKHLLRDLGMLNSSYALNMLMLGGFLIFFRIIAFLAIRHRLTSQLSNNVVVLYVNKILEM